MSNYNQTDIDFNESSKRTCGGSGHAIIRHRGRLGQCIKQAADGVEGVPHPPLRVRDWLVH